jgi:hypothetical protein
MRVTTLDHYDFPEGSEILPPKERRKKWETKKLCDQLYAILAENPPMTVRQVFYQMASRHGHAKTEDFYGNVVSPLLTSMRRAGTLPFEWIADHTRWVRKPTVYGSAGEAVISILDCYRHDYWADQPTYVGVWCEKDTLAAFIERATRPLQVPLMIGKGFSSLSYNREVAKEIIHASKPAHIFYFGDYDKSGFDIENSIRSDVLEFAKGAEVHWERVAIVKPQIRTLKLPTRPPKPHDLKDKQGRFEKGCVELDALPPSILRQMVKECIERHIDREAWERSQADEIKERRLLREWTGARDY